MTSKDMTNPNVSQLLDKNSPAGDKIVFHTMHKFQQLPCLCYIKKRRKVTKEKSPQTKRPFLKSQHVNSEQVNKSREGTTQSYPTFLRVSKLKNVIKR